MVRPDTYATLAEAENFLFLGLPDDNEPWTDATEERRLQALESATRMMLRLPWIGLPATVSQRLFHPVAGETTVPNDLKEACTLIAVALLSGRNGEGEYMSALYTQEKFGQMSLTRDTHDKAPHLLAGIPSFEAWRLIRPYLTLEQTVTITRGD